MNFKHWLLSETINSDTKEITRKIKALKIKGWGGLCGQAAIQINHNVFNGKGKYLVAVNEFLWDFENKLVGHVVVKYNNKLWDVDGLTTMDKLESWGMVDEQEYSDIFGWTTEDAYKVKIMEMTEDQIKKWFNICGI